MAGPSKILTIQDLEAMTAAERATAISEAIVTDLSALDDHTAELVSRGAARVQDRLQAQD